jgi:hypothetical protein
LRADQIVPSDAGRDDGQQDDREQDAAHDSSLGES